MEGLTITDNFIPYWKRNPTGLDTCRICEKIDEHRYIIGYAATSQPLHVASGNTAKLVLITKPIGGFLNIYKLDTDVEESGMLKNVTNISGVTIYRLNQLQEPFEKFQRNVYTNEKLDLERENMFEELTPEEEIMDNLEEMEIEIVDSKVQRTMQSMITVAKKGRISLSLEARTKLDVKEGDYLIFGKVGEANFVAKRPVGKGLFGYPVKKPKKSTVHHVASITLMHIPQGRHNFGDAVFKGGFTWFPLVKID